MADRLFLSCWLKREKKAELRQFEKMLRLFPFSRLAKRGPELRVYAIAHAEPPLFERDFPPGTLPEAMVEAASEFMHEDCACEIDAAWDLMQFDREWKLAPSLVTLICLGPDFENELGDHLRIEFGIDALFLPDPQISGSTRMSQSNLKSLVHLIREIETGLDLDRRQLWSESGLSPVDLISQAL
jgi:hypothetical protein